jgi:hypothetical protein
MEGEVVQPDLEEQRVQVEEVALEVGSELLV